MTVFTTARAHDEMDPQRNFSNGFILLFSHTFTDSLSVSTFFFLFFPSKFPDKAIGFSSFSSSFLSFSFTCLASIHVYLPILVLLLLSALFVYIPIESITNIDWSWLDAFNGFCWFCCSSFGSTLNRTECRHNQCLFYSIVL